MKKTKSKPETAPQQKAGGDCPSAPCSPSSLTPETDAMLAADLHHLEDDETCPVSAYWRMVELTRTLERERDSWRGKAVDLHARHKNALEDIETAIAERNMARATANTFRQCAEVTFGVMPFPRKFHWENDQIHPR